MAGHFFVFFSDFSLAIYKKIRPHINYRQLGKSPKEITDFLNRQLALPVKKVDVGYLYDKICLLLETKAKNYSDLENSYNKLIAISTYKSRFNLTDEVAQSINKAGHCEAAWQILIEAAEQSQRAQQRANFYRSAARISAKMGKLKRAKDEYEKALELLTYWRDNLPREPNREKWVETANTTIKITKKNMQKYALDKLK